jgi:hypothetical protein
MFSGTFAEEREVLTACLDRLHLGQRQVVRYLTRSGLQVPADERMLSYLRENLGGLDEETLNDFLAKNRGQHPIEPDLNPGDHLVCVGEEEFGHIFRDGDGWARFRREFPESDGTLRFSRVGLDGDAGDALRWTTVRLEHRFRWLLAFLETRGRMDRSCQRGTLDVIEV